MGTNRLAWVVVVLGLFIASTCPRAATIQVYNDQASWELQSPGFSTEDFEGGALSDGLMIASDLGSIRNGMWQDIVTPDRPGGRDDSTRTRFDFSSEIMSLGGIWNTVPAGHGTKIRITLINDQEQVLSSEIPHLRGEFWGLVADTPFTSVLLTVGSHAGVKETFHLDNLVFGSYVPETTPDASLAPVSAVPLPASFMLFGSGLLGLAMIRRHSTITARDT